MLRKVLVIALSLNLVGCSPSFNPSSPYYLFFEYPEHQYQWPLFNYFLPQYYPQLYWNYGYYFNQYYARPPKASKNKEKRQKDSLYVPDRNTGVRRSRQK